MLRFLATRILAAIPVLLVLSVVTFAIIKAQPGDYADYLKSMLMSQGNVSNADAQVQADAYRAAHGLNEPLPIQYINWVTGIVTRFDFGQSLYYNRPVGDVVAERLPADAFAGAHLPHPGVVYRHRTRDCRRHPTIQLG